MWIYRLFLSLTLALSPFLATPAHAQACFDIFRGSEHSEALSDFEIVLKKKGMTYMRAFATPEYARIQKMVLAKLESNGVEVSHGMDPTGKFIDVLKVLPTDKSDLNRLAKEFSRKGQTEILVSLTENIASSSILHQYRVEPKNKMVSIYNISLIQLFDHGWGPRSRFHRHEMRHHNFRSQVIEQVKAQKPIPITTGSVLHMEGESFPEIIKVTSILSNRHDDMGTRYNTELTLPHYRNFLSIEEMWTYLRDMQVGARHLSVKLKNANHAEHTLVEELKDYLFDLEMVVHIYFRLAQIERWKSVDFFATTLSPDGDVVLRGDIKLDRELFNQISHTFYSSQVETGHMILVTPTNSKFIISTPLEVTRKSTLEELRLKMLTRLVKTAKIAASGATGIYEGYIRIGHTHQGILSPDPAVLDKITPTHLKAIAKEVDIFLGTLNQLNKDLLEANEDPFKPNFVPE